MYGRGKATSLNDDTGICLVNALEPSNVLSIYYEENTPSAWTPVRRGGEGETTVGYPPTPPQPPAPLPSPTVSLDMEWDQDEPPTQVFSPRHLLPDVPPQQAPRPSRQPTLQRAAPTRKPVASARSTQPHAPIPPDLATYGRPAPSAHDASAYGYAQEAPSYERAVPHNEPYGHYAPDPQEAAAYGRPGPHTQQAVAYGRPAPRQPTAASTQTRRAITQPIPVPPQELAAMPAARMRKTIRPPAADTSGHFPPPPTRSAAFPPQQPFVPPTSDYDPRSRKHSLQPFERSANPDDVAWKTKRNPWMGRLLAGVGLVVVGLAARYFFSGPTTAVVTLETTPTDASVRIDGLELVGNSPYSREGLRVGSHELQVRKPGYLDHRETFSVTSGEPVRLAAVRLEQPPVAPLPADTGFTINSTPPGAEVRVDGKPAGIVTPARVLQVTPGSHAIRLELDGYQPAEQSLDVAQGSVVAATDVTLQAQRGRRAAAQSSSSASSAEEAKAERSAARAAIIRERWLERHPPRNGAARETVVAEPPSSSPSRSERAEARAARAAEHAEARAARAAERAEARAARAESKSARAVASPASDDADDDPAPKRSAAGGGIGMLQINSRPWSQVYIDGNLIGNTPKFGVALPAGKHSVKLVNAQMGMTKTISVAIQAGETTTKVENLAD